MAATAANRVRASQRRELEQALRQRVSGEVRFDPFSRVLYSTDASIYQMEPVGVVIPRSAADVQATLEVARDNRVPVLPRAGGTSLAGQTVNHAIVMDFSKYLNQVMEVNREESWARVQPGIVLDQLNRELLPYGLMYAPDPTTSSRACVGGGVGNNTCGAHSVIYGKTLDHIKELDVILADASATHFRPLDSAELEAKLSGAGLESEIYRGVRRLAQDNDAQIRARYPNIMRRVSGYNLDEFLTDPVGPYAGSALSHGFNLTRMVVGSEGTLCVATEAKVNLVPRPVMTALSVAHFRDIFQASEAVKEVLNHGPSSIEIMDKNVLDRSRQSLGLGSAMSLIEPDPISGQNPGAILAIEFYGESEAELNSKMEGLKQDLERRRLGYACVNLLDRAAQTSVWNVRKNGLGLLMSMHGDAKPLPFVEDTAVDPETMGEFVRRFDEIVRNHGTEAAYYGHASVGCLHIRPVVSLKDQAGVDRMYAIADEISDLTRDFGGSLSGEHGDGIVRGVWNEKMFGPEIYQLFRELKATFDPDGIMNPGKIIDCPPMTENLRYGPNYRAQSLPATLDFSIDANFAGAVEMCNGMGACRKLDGTMCPSFMATREEGTLHPRAGQPAAGGNVRQAARRRDDQPAPLRRPRPVPRMQRLSRRMRVRRGSGEAEIRVPRQLLQGQRAAPAQPHIRQYRQAERLGQPLRPPIQLGRRQPAGQAAVQRAAGRPPQPTPPALRPPNLPPMVPRKARGHRSKQRKGRRKSHCSNGGAAQRHLYELQLPGNRAGGGGPAGSRRLQGGAGRRPLLRASDDFQRDDGRGGGQRPPQRKPAPCLRGQRRPHHRLRT